MANQQKIESALLSSLDHWLKATREEELANGTNQPGIVSAQLGAGLGLLARHLAAVEARLAELEGKGIKYSGVWQRAQDYKRGDVVTYDGSAWVATAEETRAQPGATNGWQLLVKGTR
jgi:hypothetical protein